MDFSAKMGWTALVVGPDGIRGVRLARANGSLSVAASGFWPLPPADEAQPQDGADAKADSEGPDSAQAAADPQVAAALDDGRWADTLSKAARGLGGGAISLCLPTSQLLVKAIDLPTEASGDLDDIVPLQMDKVSPFQGEELTTGHEILAEGDGHLRVFAASLPESIANRWDARLRAAGLKARRIDSSLLGWWWALSEDGSLPECAGRRAVLVECSGEWDLLLLENGVPVLCRNIGRHDAASDTGRADLARELLLSLFSAELHGAGDAVAEIVVVSSAGQSTQLADALSNAAGGAPVRFVGYDPEKSGPAASGCARRAANEAPLDIIPESWRHREMSAVARRRYFIGMTAAGIVWLLLLAGLLLAPRINDRLEQRVRAEIERDKQEYYEVRDVRDRVRLIRSYMDRSRSMLECLREISGLLPDGVLFTGLTYRREDGVKIAGEAQEAGQVYAFKDAVDNCGLFDSSTLTGPTRNAAKKRERFEIDARFDPPKEGARK